MSKSKEDKLQSILNEFAINTLNGVIVFDGKDNIIFCNNAAAELYGFEHYYELQNLTFRQAITHCYQSKKGLIVDTDDLDAWFKYAEKIRRSETHRRFEIDLNNGRWHLVSEQIVDDNCIVVVSIDITDKKHAELRLAEMTKQLLVLATTDALTNTFNRRHFTEQAIIKQQQCKREQKSYALLMLDLDHFKSINDNYGHACGDKVLIEIASALKSELRPYDILGRIGGEEFAILLPSTNKSSALSIAQRIRESIENLRIKYKQNTLRVTTSIGVAVDLDTDKNLDELFLEADKRLYKAKENGRNLVAIGKV